MPMCAYLGEHVYGVYDEWEPVLTNIPAHQVPAEKNKVPKASHDHEYFRPEI